MRKQMLTMCCASHAAHAEVERVSPDLRRAVPILALGAFLGCQPAVQTAAPAPSEAYATHWRDGLAEVATYALQQPRYGEQRRGEAVLVTVVEPFHPARLVKQDTPTPPYREVWKLNDIRQFQTGAYEYRTMSSTFMDVTASSPLKITASVQEWCGHTFEELRWGKRTIERNMHSYLEADPHDTERWERPELGLSEDAFPLLMRRATGTSFLQSGEQRNIHWLPGRVGSRLRNEHNGWQEATLARSPKTQPFETPEGWRDADVWSVTYGTSEHVWYIDADWPHSVLGWTRSDGEQAQRTTLQRTDYWNRQSNADEPSNVMYKHD